MNALALLTPLLAAWPLLLVATDLASSPQDPQYRERQVLDPETDEWVDEAPPVEESPADELGQARALLAEGRPREARKLLEDWIEAYPEDDRYYEAMYLLGDAWFEQRDYWRAVERYQTVAENAAGELFRRANYRCVDVARAFLSGEKRIVWTIFRLPAFDDGIEILDRVWQRVPGSRLGELALKLKADYYFEQGDMDLAQDEYAFLAAQYPNGRYVQIAMLRAAESADAAFPGIHFDSLPLIEAQERYRQVEAAFPGYAKLENVPARLDGIRELLAEKDLDIARWYQRTKQPAAAEFYYRLVLTDWPNTLAASEATARLQGLGAELPGATPAPETEP